MSTSEKIRLEFLTSLKGLIRYEDSRNTFMCRHCMTKILMLIDYRDKQLF